MYVQMRNKKKVIQKKLKRQAKVIWDGVSMYHQLSHW